MYLPCIPGIEKLWMTALQSDMVLRYGCTAGRQNRQASASFRDIWRRQRHPGIPLGIPGDWWENHECPQLMVYYLEFVKKTDRHRRMNYRRPTTVCSRPVMRHRGGPRARRRGCAPPTAEAERSEMGRSHTIQF